MNLELVGDAGSQLAKIHLGSGEVAKIENGAMVYMQDVKLEGKLNSSKKGLGGLLGAIGRSLVSNESMFITQVVGTAPEGVVAI
ncbi:MAG: AIM24 family protein, partial [Eubacterium sp.]|nr:AIM24 family protein [Eubacterium sp.]